MFKVGDKVKVIAGWSQHEGVHGFVKEVEGDDCKVKLNGASIDLWFKSSELQKVSSKS